MRPLSLSVLASLQRTDGQNHLVRLEQGRRFPITDTVKNRLIEKLLLKEERLLQREQLFARKRLLAQELSIKTKHLRNVCLSKREHRSQAIYYPVSKSVNPDVSTKVTKTSTCASGHQIKSV